MDFKTDCQIVVTRATPAGAKAPRRFVKQQVPESITNDPALKAAMSVLPPNYNLEIPKTIWRIKQVGAKRVALQFPEGLLLYSLTICDILEAFAGVEECFVLGDVTYGACCVDDFSAVALGAEFLVHYGHSCLVPIDISQIPCQYVFVDIQIDVHHLVETVKHNFSKDQKIALAGTIQFATAIQVAKAALTDCFFSVMVPQSKPLSPGEVLGCTAPRLPQGAADVAVFVADGRFHLEAFMIANPEVQAFRYDPYSKVMTLEEYDQLGMKEARRKAVEQARRGKHWGVVLGTLGRQGNPKVLNHVEQRLISRGINYNVFLISELSPQKIALFEDTVDSWVQIACPRLSIDWGEAFHRPLLTPFEAEVCLGFVSPWWSVEESQDDCATCMDAKQGGFCGDCGSMVDSGNGGRSSEGGMSNGTVNDAVKSECEAFAHSASKVSEKSIYPMDYYAQGGGPWNSVYVQKASSQRNQQRILK